MIGKKNASVMCGVDSWEIFAPVDKTKLTDISLTVPKDITSHDYFEILMGLKGRYSYFFNDQCYLCKAGSIFLISPWTVHESYYSGTFEPLMHLWIDINEDYAFIKILEVKPDSINYVFRTKIHYDSYNPHMQIYEIWNSLLNNPDEYSSYIIEFEKAYIRLIKAIIESKPLSKSDYQNEIMLKTRNYLKNNFQERISIKQLAQKMGYSKFHFMRLFKRYHTLTIQEYIDQLRIKKVKQMLKAKNTQKEMAQQLGFSSQSSFANWYAKYR